MNFRAALTGWRGPSLIAAVFLAAGVAWFQFRPEPSIEGRRSDAARLMNELMVGKTPVGGPFTLADPDGRRRHLSDFRGKLVLLYFGYATCPDVCPIDLMAIGQLIRSLEAEGDEVQPVFVTLDPERDTHQVLRAYATSFHPRFVSLTGTEAEVRRVATSYKVFFEKVTPPGASLYLIDHAAFVFLLDREGRYVGLFPPGTPPERMAVIVREVLTKPIAQ